ncbi:MAG: hypothetical protein JRI65_13635, partial [Deltaproteobacteria bacterium]|nr:hypothetical protein [Deltaproteobacteria bacterium]
MISRREVLKGVVAGTAAFALSKVTGPMAWASGHGGHGEGKVVSPQEAIARLR